MEPKNETRTTCERKQAVMQHWRDVLGRELCYPDPNWFYIREIVAHLQKAADEGLKAHPWMGKALAERATKYYTTEDWDKAKNDPNLLDDDDETDF